MKVALGLRAHSGWAALVAVGARHGAPTLVDRRRVELVEEPVLWAKQPYHAAEGAPAEEARAIVARGVEGAQRRARAEVQAAADRARAAGHEVVAVAVVTGKPMPAWSVEEILAVHARMHKAEGALFRDVLLAAAEACGLRAVGVPEDRLAEHAARVVDAIAALGRAAGAPWGKDQKDAATAALVGLEG